MAGGWELLGLIFIAGGAWLWLDSLKARDGGIAAARTACNAEGLQLLDDTVSLASLRLARILSLKQRPASSSAAAGRNDTTARTTSAADMRRRSLDDTGITNRAG